MKQNHVRISNLWNKPPKIGICLFLLMCLFLFNQNKVFSQTSEVKEQISGNIVDEDGIPIIGANILVKGTTKGSTSDMEGNFKLESKKGDIIVVTFIGYKTQEIQVGNQTMYNINLSPDATMLGEVMVTALGIKRDQKALGYSVQKINGEDVNVVRGVSVTSSLTGKVSGMYVANSTDFNTPSEIELRGASPLIVIDGIAGYNVGLSELSPEDIQSFDVLKGGSASALYGSAGKNGVIMVTTKRANKEGVVISANSNTMFHSGFLKLPKSQAAYSSGIGGKYTDPEFNNLDYVWGDKLDIGRTAKQYNPLTFQYEEMPLTSRGKDNFNNFLENALITNNNINVNYKGKEGDFRTSLTHVYQKAPFPNNTLNKFIFSIAGSVKLSNRLSIDASMNYSKQYVPQTRGSGYGGNGYIYNLLVWTGPDYDLRDFKNYWVKGKEGEVQNWQYKKWYNNPYYLAYEAKNSVFSDKLNSQLTANYQATSWLKTITRIGYDFFSEREETIYPMDHRSMPKGEYSIDNSRSFMINGDFIAMANHKISDFEIDGLLGSSIKLSENDNHASNTKGGLSLPGYYSLKAGNEGQEATSSVDKTRTNSMFAKFGVSWKSLLFVEATGRNDWSSRLDTKNRSYFYPSVSGSLILSEVFNLPSWFQFWKLRGGWSVSKDVPGFAELNNSYIVKSNIWNQVIGAELPDDLRPSSLSPSKQTDWEIGKELVFLNGRLRFDIAYYEKLYQNRILSTSISDAGGYGYLFINRGEELKRKGLEISITGSPIKSQFFEWKSTFNWTREREVYYKLDEFSSDELWVHRGGRTGAYTTRLWETDPQGNLVHDASGFPILKSKNEQIGYGDPDWVFGFINEFKYKNFTLNMSIDGRIGGFMFDRTEQAMWHSGTHIDSDNQWRYDEVVNGLSNYVGQGVKVVSGTVEYDSYGRVIHDDRVFAPNDIQVSYESYITEYHNNSGGNMARQNIKNQSFFKLRELSLAYNLPKFITSKLKLRNASIALVGQNVFIWCKEFKYSDPDGNRNGLISPSVRYLGFNLKFDF